MKLDLGTILILLLLVFWLYLASGAYEAGATGRALLFLAIGVVLTLYRFRRRATS